MNKLLTARLISVALASLGCGAALHASDASAVDSAPHFEQPLTLMQLTDLALSNNPSTKIAWAQVRSSEAGLELARAGYWPQLSVDYSYERLKQVDFSGGANPAQNRYGPSINLSYLLWDFGVRSGTADAANYSLTAAQLDANQTVQDLILQVEQDYYQVLGLQALQDADLQSVQDASANLDAADQRKNTGLATLGDVYQAEAALAGAKLALQTAQGQLAAAHGTLALAVGFAADSSVPLAPWETEIAANMPEQNIHDLLNQAQQARPELLASKAQEQAAVASLEATRAQGWPTLNLDANAGRTTTDVSSQKTTTSAYSAGLTLSFPLFTGFANQAQSRQAQAALDVAQASDAQLVQAVQLEVWQ